MPTRTKMKMIYKTTKWKPWPKNSEAKNANTCKNEENTTTTDGGEDEQKQQTRKVTKGHGSLQS